MDNIPVFYLNLFKSTNKYSKTTSQRFQPTNLSLLYRKPLDLEKIIGFLLHIHFSSLPLQ